MDLSLDDIIQKRKVKFPARGRGGPNRPRQQGRRNNINRTENNNANKNNQRSRDAGGGVNTGRIVRANQTRPITDARLRIIQKNRQRLTDAREKLGEIAKQTDARFKLDKLRVGRQGGRFPVQGANARGLGRRVPPQMRDPQVQLQRTILQAVGTVVVPNNWYGSNLDEMDVDMDEEVPMTGVSQVLCRTIPNEQAAVRHTARPPPLQRPALYGTTKSNVNPNGILQYFEKTDPERCGRGFTDSNYSAEDRSRVKPQPASSLTSRWGRGATTSQVQPTAAKPRSTGYRIVISNLHPGVIHEDIQELFEDVGPLLESRLVRPGTAEVVFKLVKDAEKAVDIYHNRQLDGQPMKCLLVNARPSTSSSPPPSHSAPRTLSASIARTGVKVASGTKSSVVPDISTIHKALFSKS